MGMYTGLRCKAIIKQEYRDEFTYLDSINYEWSESHFDTLQDYSSYSRATFIPRGVLSYMPDSWEDEEENATDGFNRRFDKETGLWTFQCSLKNYNQTIQYFFEHVLSEVAQEIIHLEYYYEESARSTFYELKDGKIVVSNRKGIQYGYEEENHNGWCDGYSEYRRADEDMYK